MEEDIDNIKKEINNLAIKYGIRYIVFKTTSTHFCEGNVMGCEVEAEIMY